MIDNDRGWNALARRLSNAVIGPFADFMRRPLWLVIILFIVGYKLGEATAGAMSTPLYISLGFSLDEIAAMSKLVGMFAIVAGALIGGLVTVRFGILRSLLLCGVLQAVGNLAYVLQAQEGHRLAYLALCVTAENLTAGWQERRSSLISPVCAHRRSPPLNMRCFPRSHP